ncbi:hypothetical protein C8D94_10730 [Marinirhabdus gelatinilytica]|uniref:Uncharacterized protein n=1 Tax=Marinirhabdus gelatinilytica TaxID=1703343 RepID=A0A370Q552_9FLAO|nr:hypothetical protein C8D94_10730 [Marinirhabdus gelatinilytica]
MKLKNYLFLAAIFGATLFVSCTPESIEDEQTEQQIKNPDIPKAG